MKTSYKQQFRDICKSYNFPYIAKPKFNNSIYADLPYLHPWSFLLKYDVRSYRIYIPEYLTFNHDNEYIFCFGVEDYDPIKFSKLVSDYRSLVHKKKQYNIKLKLNDIQKDFI